MRIVLLNGPPRCGKDTVAGILATRLPNVRRIGLADHLKSMVHAAYGLPMDPFHLEEAKDEPNAAMYGMTPRQAYIHFSEKVMKPLHGDEFFAAMLLRKARGFGAGTVAVVPDSGFVREALALRDGVEPENMLLVRISRVGRDFSNDSRDWVHLEGHTVEAMDVLNEDGKARECAAKIEAVIRRKWTP